VQPDGRTPRDRCAAGHSNLKQRLSCLS
jgi:hypothetical protein